MTQLAGTDDAANGFYSLTSRVVTRVDPVDACQERPPGVCARSRWVLAGTSAPRLLALALRGVSVLRGGNTGSCKTAWLGDLTERMLALLEEPVTLLMRETREWRTR